MTYVRIYDNSKKAVVRVELESDDTITSYNFNGLFPGATGILYKDKDSNEYVGFVIKKKKENIEKHVFYLCRVRMNAERNFKCNWDTTVIYELVYLDRKKRKK
jgi:hypothetical protein